MPNQYTHVPFPARFWQYVDQSGGNDACWTWQAHRSGDGYGVCRFDKKCTLAHRVAWILTHGAIPPDLHVLHRCDNPACVNPTHLFLGTHDDNMKDMARKGRSGVRGDRNPNVKLNPDLVREIRARYVQGDTTFVKLATEYGVKASAIDKLIHRRTWRYVV